MVQRFLKLHFC